MMLSLLWRCRALMCSYLIWCCLCCEGAEPWCVLTWYNVVPAVKVQSPDVFLPDMMLPLLWRCRVLMCSYLIWCCPYCDGVESWCVLTYDVVPAVKVYSPDVFLPDMMFSLLWRCRVLVCSYLIWCCLCCEGVEPWCVLTWYDVVPAVKV